MNIPGPLTQLGRYQLNSVLGRGAMGLVYEATDPRLGRKVALKTILKSHLLDDAMAREYSARFVREAQAAARLNHPNIVTVFDFGEEDEVAYLVMEFIEGRELAQHFEDNHFFDLPGAVHILCELLDALAYAHDRGIVHRDIKPANVMIDQQGRVKLTDFGVARLADSNADRTLPGTMVGTPSYMSPEQIQGQAVGSRTDLFAAGVILYQFLTHQRPFTGGGQWTIQRKIVSEDPVPPSFANKAVPPVFDAIVKRALAKHPDQRYQSAAAFAADLRRALDTVAGDPDATVLIPHPARPVAGTAPVAPVGAPASRAGTLAPEPAAGGVSPTATTLTHPPQPAPPPRAAPAPAGAAARQAWPWLAALGGIGALASALAWWQSGDAGTPPPSAPPATTPGAAATEPVPMPAPAAAPPAATAAVPEAPAAVPPGMADRPGQATMTDRRSGGPPAQAPGAAGAEAMASPAPPKTTPPPTPTLRRPREAGTGANEPTRAADGALAPAPRANSARCADLLQRLQLGEDLSPENLSVFQKECKR